MAAKFSRSSGGGGRRPPSGDKRPRKPSSESSDRPARSDRSERSERSSSSRPSGRPSARTSERYSRDKSAKPSRSASPASGRTTSRTPDRFSRDKTAKPSRSGGAPERFSRDRDSKPSRSFRDKDRDEKPAVRGDRPVKSFGSVIPKTREKTRLVRPKIDKGPWKDSVYMPSAFMKPKVRPVGQKPMDAKPKKHVTRDDIAAPDADKDGKERLQKVLAKCGVASRRKAELLILEGAVTINGKPATELGVKVDPLKDKIKVNGTLIYTDREPIYLALYKPKGMIASLSDPEGRRHIGHIVASIRERVIPIGRLNFNSEGLMLLTNDGDLAEKILKARGLPKIYMVKVKGHPDEAHLESLKRGFFTADGVVRFQSYGIEQSLRNKSWLKLEVIEGSSLDLREMLNQRGLLVDRIVRTAIGSISIKGLEPGEYRFMKRQDFEKVLELTTEK